MPRRTPAARPARAPRRWGRRRGSSGPLRGRRRGRTRSASSAASRAAAGLATSSASATTPSSASRATAGCGEVRNARSTPIAAATVSGDGSASAPRATGSTLGSPIASSARSIAGPRARGRGGEFLEEPFDGPRPDQREPGHRRLARDIVGAAQRVDQLAQFWRAACLARSLTVCVFIVRLPLNESPSYCSRTTSAARRFRRRVSSRALSNFGRSSP